MAACAFQIALRRWSPNKSSLYDVKQNKRLALWEQTTNLDYERLWRLKHILSTANQKVGGAGRDRTDDILLAKQALSQLSYGP